MSPTVFPQKCANTVFLIVSRPTSARQCLVSDVCRRAVAASGAPCSKIMAQNTNKSMKVCLAKSFSQTVRATLLPARQIRQDSWVDGKPKDLKAKTPGNRPQKEYFLFWRRFDELLQNNKKTHYFSFEFIVSCSYRCRKIIRLAMEDLIGKDSNVVKSIFVCSLGKLVLD